MKKRKIFTTEEKIKRSKVLLVLLPVICILHFWVMDDKVVAVCDIVKVGVVLFQILIYLKVIPAKKEQWYVMSKLLWGLTYWLVVIKMQLEVCRFLYKVLKEFVQLILL